MAKKEVTGEKATDLEALALRLDAMAQEANTLGEERVEKSIRNAAKSARWADTQRAARLRRVGGIVEAMKAKGLSAEEIVKRLTSGQR